ncbi:MAG TPA: hypothetical protein DHV12_02155, partial [Thermotogae bacterium]|nr:hypothetical protein [Thermotogota bacterium]
MFEKSRSRTMFNLSNDGCKNLSNRIFQTLLYPLTSAKRLTWRLNPLFQHFIETICLTVLESLVSLLITHLG